jgi:enoyl-CoA hydratase/carnithine racemase
MNNTVTSSIDRGVCTITLNRPESLNAINRDLLTALKAILRDGNADPAVKVFVMRGGGRAFCAGQDLKEFEEYAGDEAESRAYLESIQEITRSMVLGEKLIVGAIHGWAVGGGLEWLINCDLAIMASDTRCFFPEISLGVFVTGGVSTLLPKLVGLQKARELILFGEQFDAQQAQAMGLAWKVVPQTELFSEADAVARRIADLPQEAVRDFKRVINRACHMNVEGAMALETEAAVRGFLDPTSTQRTGKFKKQE